MKPIYFVGASKGAKIVHFNDTRGEADKLYSAFKKMGYPAVMYEAHEIQAEWGFPKPRPLILHEHYARMVVDLCGSMETFGTRTNEGTVISFLGGRVIVSAATGECEEYASVADFMAVYKIGVSK